jgi:hypothetical protein
MQMDFFTPLPKGQIKNFAYPQNSRIPDENGLATL